MTTVLRQTGAMFVDAYRELAAGRLFWITLILSAVVALAFAAVGIDKQGLSVLWYRLPFGPNSDDLSPALLYKFLFFNFGLGVWLTWIATILALVTTAGIIPSLVSSGVIDSMVAKPISRWRLFLTRFATGMLFALLQVTLFSVSAFLVIGFRGGDWLWSAFLAIPIVLVFYSYLFSIMALIGLVTRSTITSLLLTLLIWFLLFIINAVDASLVQFHESAKLRIETAERRIERVESNTAQQYIIQQRQQGNDLPDEYEPTPTELDSINPFLSRMRSGLEEAREDENDLRPWTHGLFLAKTFLPKTSETISLLNRYVMSREEGLELVALFAGDRDRPEPTIDEESGEVWVPQETQQMAAQDRLASRSLGWILGTSLLFEGVILGICCVIFARRDF
ncbi:MAG: hypothetical protein ACTS22_06180 [Phycisphaerales bacterium]